MLLPLKLTLLLAINEKRRRSLPNAAFFLSPDYQDLPVIIVVNQKKNNPVKIANEIAK
jgi:hypothetical protein